MKRSAAPGPLVAAIAAALLLVAGRVPTAGAATPGGPAAQRVVTTPWGQRVAPNLDNLVDILSWQALRPGQPWEDARDVGPPLRAQAAAGRLDVERYPWRVASGTWVLGHEGFEQRSYLIDTGAGLLLVDPSLDRWQDELVAEIRRLGLREREVRWVLLTHAHIDHGQSVASWRRRGARLLVGAGDAHAIESCNSLVATWVEPQADGHCTPAPVDQRVEDGDVLRLGTLELHAIAVPGHTPGSMAYAFRRDGEWLLLSGDVALHNGRHAWMGNPYADWDQYLASLGKLQRFAVAGQRVGFDVLLPGHGTIDLEQAQRSVRETGRVVRSLIVRRRAGEDVEWIEPYPWNWAAGVRYGAGSADLPAHDREPAPRR